MGLTAVGRLIGTIHAIVVPVTHPHSWNTALGDGTLELVGGACHLRYTEDGGSMLNTQKK